MPPETRTQTRMPFSPDIVLPPPFTLLKLREVGDAFAHATAIAAESGAGTLVYVGRFDLAEFAVVLEPDGPLRSARRSFYAGMTALADALMAYAPPETPLAIGWPDAVLINGALVGGGRLSWPRDADESKSASWLVFGAMIRTVSLSNEPGLNPWTTALEEEGFTDFAAARLVESFARHLMLAIDSWQEHGFAAVANGYLARLSGETGARFDLDGNGDLLTRRAGRTDAERKRLLSALAEPSWFDPETGGPRL
jgi:biotin-(acetyl-CoA carboxylase) ligase